MFFLYGVLFIISFIISAVGPDARVISHLFAVVTALYGLFYLYKKNGEIKLPVGFEWLLIFTLILLVYPLFLTNKVNPFFNGILFSEGLAFWLISYNFKKNEKEKLASFIFVPLIFYSLIYIASEIFKINLTQISKFFFSSDPKYPHQLIADFWAVGILYIFSGAAKNKYFKFLFAAVGIYFLVISNSRTAILSLFLIFAFINSKLLKEKKWIYPALFGLLSLFFIFKAALFPTLLSRPYFLQSIMSFPNNLLGVGVGNFRSISEKYYYSKGPLAAFSEYTHNIFLEVLSGVGIFSFIFFMWFFVVTRRIFKEKNKGAWGMVFLMITTLFFFDQLYIIPGMFWLWFVSLGAWEA